jgi:[acyl-carrier-protein] S-malonyltransferase
VCVPDEDRRIDVQTAFVFPGMGPTRFADLGRFLVADPTARGLLREADEVLGYRVAERFADTGDEYAEAAQVAFLISCLALAERARGQGLSADLCTGPSFGQKTVAAFTGALSFADAVRLTAELARALDRYFATEHRDVVTQTVVRMPGERLDPLLDDLTARGEWYEFACHVDTGFYMINMREHVLDDFVARVRGVGGLPLYAMRPPMHSRLFTGLRDHVDAEVLPRFTFADPAVPVVCDQTGELLTTGAQLRGMLLDGLVRPVRWPDTIEAIRAAGATRLVVAGQDAMFSRVECVRAFDLHAVNPRSALLPVRTGPALAAA